MVRTAFVADLRTGRFRPGLRIEARQAGRDKLQALAALGLEWAAA
ncbi:hypothetical protein ACFYT4_30685 [Streptomyces sp. NPDC004609]